MEDPSSSLDQQQIPESSPSPVNKVGGWRAIRYILGNESFEKLASMSLISNMTVYLQHKYHMGGLSNVNVINIWSGSSNITSIFGAFLADTYLGRFRTLLFGSLSSFVGMVGMTLTAGIPELTPPKCNGENKCSQPEHWQLAFLFISLGLLSIGAGGIRPCNIAFGADQFDTSTAKGRAQLESFFNWWYFLFTIALLIALTAVVYVQTNVSWVVGFAIPTACLLFSITLFLIGRHTYICKKPQGSIFVDMVKVMGAAYRKRRIKMTSESDYQFYDVATNESKSHLKIARSDRFKCLNKAALIIDSKELDSEGKPKDAWRLCSLQQVEQLKSLIGILPVWVSGIASLIAMDQQGSFGILQAIQMDTSLGSFKVPPGWMGLISMIALSLWIFIYETIFIKMCKGKRLTISQRIKIGILMSILCMIVAALVEKHRRQSALKNRTFAAPISIGLLLPQFFLSGLIEAFAAVAIMEFYTTHMPESMRTVAGAVFFLSLSITSYLGSVLINIVRVVTTKKGKTPWLGGRDLNNNRLDYYYYTIAGIGAVNFLYFTFFASRYTKVAKFVKEDDELQNSTSYEVEEETQDEEKGLKLHNNRSTIVTKEQQQQQDDDEEIENSNVKH